MVQWLYVDLDVFRLCVPSSIDSPGGHRVGSESHYPRPRRWRVAIPQMEAETPRTSSSSITEINRLPPHWQYFISALLVQISEGNYVRTLQYCSK